jgi:hypothetical protein
MLYVMRWIALYFVQGKIVCEGVSWISLVQVIVTLDENQGLDQLSRRNRRKNGLAICFFLGGGGLSEKKRNKVLW